MASSAERNVPIADYAELHCISSFTFLRGASQPEELVARAAALGYTALAITDECSLAGIVRAHTVAKEQGLKLIIGSELKPEDGPQLIALAPDRAAYGRLSRLITQGRRAAPKGEYRLTKQDVATGLTGCLVLWTPKRDDPHGRWVAETFAGRAWLAVELFAGGEDRRRLEELERLGATLGLPCVASGDVHMHLRGRRALQDVLTAIRLKTTLHEAGFALHPNGERHLRSRARLSRIYPLALLQASVDIARRCAFSLDELRYEYPREIVPPGETPAGYLRRLTEEGLGERWPGGAPEQVRRLIEHELELIAELGYEPYFLTVYDIVRFARSRGILCQGRGSAANSAVCYCLGITAVDPARMSLLMERFISKERNEPPDIDVDFEHDRREEVIQYLYAKYGRGRAALAATVISYRPRSALRDVGKALGLAPAQVDRLARATQWWDGSKLDEARIREAGVDPASPVIARLVALVESLIGFPRHLSQHVGGFVISAGPLDELVPIENAAMPERTVIEWDKDDLEDLGLLKVDVLGLGMLSAIRRSFELVREFSGRELALASVPAEDPAVYDMICAADTVGVFQIESRAQMSMLPRLKPRCYYDLVIEVAIVRPGPIQGDMVHPYLRRRSEGEPVDYPSEAVKAVLARTLGVPIFQEQVMHLAMVAAGFTAGEADSLRRAMAAWKRHGALERFEDKLIRGMRERGYPEDYAQRLFRQIQGFGEYGFPESHAASFALLVYVSAWLKRHEPAAFFGALLNSQPMGFYAPAQLVGAARRAGVEVRAVDVRVSACESTLERRVDDAAALRLGLRVIKGFGEAAAARLVAARDERPFASVQDLAERAHLDRGELGALAAAGALAGLAGHRHRARWEVAGVETPTPLLPRIEIVEALAMLERPTEGENIVADYASIGLTLERHPLALLRDRLQNDGIVNARDLWRLPDGEHVHTAGLVITRQRPGTAGGVTFVTLEDETGHVNLIVWQTVASRQRRELLGARLLGVHGRLQREGEVLHVIAGRLEDLSALLGDLTAPARNFR
ncbi:MAG: error-prone DNA polymerase [Gammaproteobacteria bacterium]|nr:error-prone DNA polymerase [Gammaproteobacteria bacterium]